MLISSADGQLMEIPNKHKEEIDAKNQHKVQLQERSTVALERIAEKIGAGASKTGQKARTAGGSLLDSFIWWASFHYNECISFYSINRPSNRCRSC